MKRTFLLLVTSLFSVISQGQNIFRDDFASYIVNQELSGQGPWSNSPIAPNVGIGACLPLSGTEPCFGTKVVAQPVSYLNYGTSANSIVLAPVQDGVAHAITPIVIDGDLYVGLVLNLTSAPTAAGSPVDFLRVINSDPTQVTFRLLVRDAGFGYTVGIRKGGSSNPTAYTTDLFNYGENVLVIMKYSHLAGPDDDVASIFVNPNYASGEPLTPSASTASGIDQSGAIDRFAFRLNYNVAASMPNGYAGLVSTSTTWDGLTFLPLSVDQFQRDILKANGILENGQLQLSAQAALTNAKFTLFSATGARLENKVLSIPSGNSQITIDSKLSSGLYIAQILDQNGTKYLFKVISK